MSLYYFNLLITILFLLYLSKGAVSEWLSLPDVPIIFWSCVRCADTLFSGAKVPKSSPKTPARILCGRRNSSFIVSGPETSQTGLDWTLLCHSNSFYIYIYICIIPYQTTVPCTVIVCTMQTISQLWPIVAPSDNFLTHIWHAHPVDIALARWQWAWWHPNDWAE